MSVNLIETYNSSARSWVSFLPGFSGNALRPGITRGTRHSRVSLMTAELMENSKLWHMHNLMVSFAFTDHLTHYECVSRNYVYTYISAFHSIKAFDARKSRHALCENTRIRH